MKGKHWIVHEEPIAGFSMINIIRVLIQNRFKIHPKYWLRFLYAFSISMFTLPLRIIEKILFTGKIKRTKIINDPLFIIGHYRTGTTYLITLISNDKSKGYVSHVEAYAPHTFLAFPNFTKWIIDLSVPDQRPMDNVIIGSEKPTEEEYSIAATDKYSFYNGLIFPRNFDQYSKYNSFEECSFKDLQRWEKKYYYFVQKMTLKYSGKILILKNPANTYRIRIILKMFPNAKFIHIYRNPYDVFPSTLKFLRELLEIYALQKWDDNKMQEDIFRNFKEMYTIFHRDRHLIPEKNIVDIRYENFIRNPMATIERIYRELNLENFEKYKDSFQKYVNSQATYKANIHIITDDIIRRVNMHWGFYIEKYGYKKLEPKTENKKSITSESVEY